MSFIGLFDSGKGNGTVVQYNYRSMYERSDSKNKWLRVTQYVKQYYNTACTIILEYYISLLLSISKTLYQCDFLFQFSMPMNKYILHR